MRIGQTSVVFFVSKVIGSAIGFLATVYFARVLGEEILGFYALVLSIVAWLSLLGTVGFSGAITKRISEGREQERYATAGALLIAGVGTLVAVGVLLFRSTINAYVGQPVALFTAIILLTSLSTSFVYAALRGYQLVHVYAILSTTKLGARSLIQVALVFLGFQLAGLLIGYATAALVFTIIGLTILRIRPSVPDKEHFASLLDYAKFSWLGSVRGKTFNEVDILILGVFVHAGLIGVYSVAWSISKFLDIFGSAVSTTMFPEMSEIATEQDIASVSGLVEDALAFAGLIIIPGLVGGFILADRIMAIYGPGFVVGRAVLPVLIAALLLYTYNQQLTNTLNAIDRPDLAFRANAVFIASNIALNVALIWWIGWLGAAIATALSAAIGLAFAFYFVRMLVSFRIPIPELARQAGAALVMGAAVYALRQYGEARWAWISDYNAAFVILLVGMGASLYFLVLFGISREFRNTVDRNVPFEVSFGSR